MPSIGAASATYAPTHPAMNSSGVRWNIGPPLRPAIAGIASIEQIGLVLVERNLV
jgi:hypothetical protein